MKKITGIKKIYLTVFLFIVLLPLNSKKRNNISQNIVKAMDDATVAKDFSVLNNKITLNFENFEVYEKDTTDKQYYNVVLEHGIQEIFQKKLNLEALTGYGKGSEMFDAEENIKNQFKSIIFKLGKDFVESRLFRIFDRGGIISNFEAARAKNIDMIAPLLINFKRDLYKSFDTSKLVDKLKKLCGYMTSFYKKCEDTIGSLYSLYEDIFKRTRSDDSKEYSYLELPSLTEKDKIKSSEVMSCLEVWLRAIITHQSLMSVIAKLSLDFINDNNIIGRFKGDMTILLLKDMSSGVVCNKNGSYIIKLPERELSIQIDSATDKSFSEGETIKEEESEILEEENKNKQNSASSLNAKNMPEFLQQVVKLDADSVFVSRQHLEVLIKNVKDLREKFGEVLCEDNINLGEILDSSSSKDSSLRIIQFQECLYFIEFVLGKLSWFFTNYFYEQERTDKELKELFELLRENVFTLFCDKEIQIGKCMCTLGRLDTRNCIVKYKFSKVYDDICGFYSWAHGEDFLKKKILDYKFIESKKEIVKKYGFGEGLKLLTAQLKKIATDAERINFTNTKPENDEKSDDNIINTIFKGKDEKSDYNIFKGKDEGSDDNIFKGKCGKLINCNDGYKEYIKELDELMNKYYDYISYKQYYKQTNDDFDSAISAIFEGEGRSSINYNSSNEEKNKFIKEIEELLAKNYTYSYKKSNDGFAMSAIFEGKGEKSLNDNGSNEGKNKFIKEIEELLAKNYTYSYKKSNDGFGMSAIFEGKGEKSINYNGSNEGKNEFIKEIRKLVHNPKLKSYIEKFTKYARSSDSFSDDKLDDVFIRMWRNIKGDVDVILDKIINYCNSDKNKEKSWFANKCKGAMGLKKYFENIDFSIYSNYEDTLKDIISFMFGKCNLKSIDGSFHEIPTFFSSCDFSYYCEYCDKIIDFILDDNQSELNFDSVESSQRVYLFLEVIRFLEKLICWLNCSDIFNNFIECVYSYIGKLIKIGCDFDEFASEYTETFDLLLGGNGIGDKVRNKIADIFKTSVLHKLVNKIKKICDAVGKLKDSCCEDIGTVYINDGKNISSYSLFGSDYVSDSGKNPYGEAILNLAEKLNSVKGDSLDSVVRSIGEQLKNAFLLTYYFYKSDPKVNEGFGGKFSDVDSLKRIIYTEEGFVGKFFDEFGSLRRSIYDVTSYGEVHNLKRCFYDALCGLFYSNEKRFCHNTLFRQSVIKSLKQVGEVGIDGVEGSKFASLFEGNSVPGCIELNKILDEFSDFVNYRDKNVSADGSRAILYKVGAFEALATGIMGVLLSENDDIIGGNAVRWVPKI